MYAVLTASMERLMYLRPRHNHQHVGPQECCHTPRHAASRNSSTNRQSCIELTMYNNKLGWLTRMSARRSAAASDGMPPGAKSVPWHRAALAEPGGIQALQRLTTSLALVSCTRRDLWNTQSAAGMQMLWSATGGAQALQRLTTSLALASCAEILKPIGYLCTTSNRCRAVSMHCSS